MKTLYLIVASAIVAGLRVAAQQLPALEAADFIGTHSKGIAYLAGKTFVFAPEPLPFVVAGNRLVAAPGATAPSSPSAPDIATHLGARMAVPGDFVRCGQSGCGPNNIVMVRLGVASVEGDSAAVPYSLSFVLGAGRQARPSFDRYVVILNRTGGRWNVVGFSGANGAVLAAPHPAGR